MRDWWGQLSPDTQYVPASSILNQIRDVQATLSGDQCILPLLNWVLVVDEIRLWLSSIFCGLQVADIEIDTPTRVRKFALGGLCASLNSVQTLVENGFDVSAKTVARQSMEYCELLYHLMEDDALCEEFFKAAEPEDANKFWHKHISKNKLQKRLRSRLAAKYPEIEASMNELDSYFKDENLVLSTASHPAYLAAAMTSMSGDSLFGIFGVIDSSSIRTLKVVFYSLFKLLTIQNKSFDSLLLLIDGKDNPFGKIALERKEYVYQLVLYVGARRDELPLDPEEISEV